MQVKVKIRCNSVTDNGYNKSANLSAVYGDFAKATPNGTLNVAIDKDAPAANFFEPQQDYFLYFEKA